jgi:polyisoprenoid-binding protein YceI
MRLWELLAGLALVAVVGGELYLVRTDALAAAHVRAAMRRKATWLVGVPALTFVLLVGGPFVYLRSTGTSAPKPLSFADLGPTSTTTPAGAAAATGATVTTTTLSAPDAVTKAGVSRPAAVATGATSVPDVSGSWVVGKGTQARYHVDDNVMGQTSEVVGSTPDVSGTMKIVGTAVTTAHVVVNMQTVTCNCVHDSKYHQMLETDTYPTSTFELTSPIVLPSVPPEGQVINVSATGNFTIHGVTRQVTFALAALRQAGRVAINGKVPVKLEDYNISSPNAGAFGSLSNCFIEFLVAFDRAG